MTFISNVHAMFARLHGGMRDKALAAGADQSDEFKAAYAEYASATAQALALLRQHGAASAQFATADITSMRLFHKVKKMQGLRKSRNS